MVSFSLIPFWLSDWPLHGTAVVRITVFSCRSYLAISLYSFAQSLNSITWSWQPCFPPGPPLFLMAFGFTVFPFLHLLLVPHLLKNLNFGMCQGSGLGFLSSSVSHLTLYAKDSKMFTSGPLLKVNLCNIALTQTQIYFPLFFPHLVMGLTT